MASLAFLPAATAGAVDVGQSLPQIAIKHVESGALTPESLQGKVTVVNFWATWCAACKVELAEMEHILKPHRAEKDFQVAFVSLDKEPQKAIDWFRGNLKDPDALLKHLYVDPAFAAADRLSVDAFPMTLVIGKDGKVAHVQRGFKEGEGMTEHLAKLSEALLKAP